MRRFPRGRAGVLTAAFVLDMVAGDPPNRLHPVAWFGRLARAWESRAPRSAAGRLAFGAASAAGLPLLYAGAGWLLSRSAHGNARVPVEAVLLKSTFAVRGLLKAGTEVSRALEMEDVAAAQGELRSLVSRDVGELDRRLAASAAIESLAENAVDSFLAPWLCYLAAGLPGAFAYRALNTLDSMWGYRNNEYEYLGKAAARLDDAVNYLPAALAPRLMLIVGGLLGMRTDEGRRMLRRDGGKTESPNAGRPMSTMAGLLGVQLEKPGAYRLGDDIEPVDAGRIAQAQRVVLATAVLGLGCAILLDQLTTGRR